MFAQKHLSKHTALTRIYTRCNAARHPTSNGVWWYIVAAAYRNLSLRWLTYCDRVSKIEDKNITIIGVGGGLVPVVYQAIIHTNDGMSSLALCEMKNIRPHQTINDGVSFIRPPRVIVRNILVKIEKRFHFRKVPEILPVIESYFPDWLVW